MIAELAGYLLNIVLPLAGVGMGAEPCDVVVFVVFLFNFFQRCKQLAGTAHVAIFLGDGFYGGVVGGALHIAAVFQAADTHKGIYLRFAAEHGGNHAITLNHATYRAGDRGV